MEMEERVTELLLAGLEGFVFSDCETASLEVLEVDVDLVKLLLGGTKVDCGSPSDDGKTGVPGGVRSQS